MPIYAYKCSSCGYAKDVLQKISDAPLTDCPECGKSSFTKQVTAAGFQLKGSGWYVTDFRNNSSGNAPAGKSAAAESSSPAADSSAASAPASTPAAPASTSTSGSTT
ncbi:FmdB family zinc ribbon protein [Bordetella genomosp. 12]|uniref:FmdB family transcriptional regulator n=1 Tax=Bordetella genomosp. 12 TaxID=463035 RepID=A0A261VE99_9BORD|nr:FmdB family zinc ribbon protein [Bordetella genomosp. 12]OZI72157.1 FmdB family transcriptional regulator [Bordetella genomosp. 12]